jgi:hypothetical protein
LSKKSLDVRIKSDQPISMKLKIIIPLVVIAALLSGCGPSNEEVPGINKTRLAQYPEVVGQLQDGREVKRWEVYSPNGRHMHFVYVIEGASTTISTNRLEMQGKVHVNKVDVVTVNGKEYVPVNK